MINNEQVNKARRIVATAIMNHCINKFGAPVYRHQEEDALIELPIEEIEHYLINHIENTIIEDGTCLFLSSEQQTLACVECYSCMLSPLDSVRSPTLSPLAIIAVENDFNGILKIELAKRDHDEDIGNH